MNYTLHYMDSHIHLDQYSDNRIESIVGSLPSQQMQSLIAVSMNMNSCLRTEQLAQRYPGMIQPAYGYHPEQPLPTRQQTRTLLKWIEARMDHMVAIGEIGLPYYQRQELMQRGEALDESGYTELLEQYLQLAKKYNKPVILHAVYEDADTVCDLLHNQQIERAHFHWFKGSSSTIKRMAERGYYISFTPDIRYESEIQEIAAIYPREQVMIETDGPWPFEGPYAGKQTLPWMVKDVCRSWATIQGMNEQDAAELLYRNTRTFYQL